MEEIPKPVKLILSAFSILIVVAMWWLWFKTSIIGHLIYTASFKAAGGALLSVFITYIAYRGIKFIWKGV